MLPQELQNKKSKKDFEIKNCLRGKPKFPDHKALVLESVIRACYTDSFTIFQEEVEA